jgi:hypothetical protein
VGGLSRWRNDTNQGAFLIGAEASWLRLRPHAFLSWGGYLDTTYDTHAALARSSAGPEVIHVGSFPFGVDLGPLIEWNASRAHVGLRTRFFVPVVFVTPYVGTTLLALGEKSVSIEAGVLLKYPILWKVPE